MTYPTSSPATTTSGNLGGLMPPQKVKGKGKSKAKPKTKKK